MPEELSWQVLDAGQLVRITATHRGFLYQHLYTVACLLKAEAHGYLCVRVEADEDIELDADDHTLYLQIKTRDGQITPSDLDGVTERFDELRAAHPSPRPGEARFAVVTNREAGPKLDGQCTDGTWPPDVEFLAGPGVTPSNSVLVAPPETLQELFGVCVELARSLSLSALRPETLVWKLAALVAAAAASEQRVIHVSELAHLCEFVEASLHPLPVVDRYLPQENEPDPDEFSRVTLITGHEGFGKSAWAANYVTHAPRLVAYVRCTGLTAELVAPRVVREVIALAAKSAIRAAQLVLPGTTGEEALAYLDCKLAELGTSLTVVVDDAHLVEAAALASAVKATSSVEWVFLARPGPQASLIEARLGVTARSLAGWSLDTVAAELHRSGCSASVDDVACLRRLTSGAPLFVEQVIDSIFAAGRETADYLAEVESRASGAPTPQEIVLGDALARLPSDARRVVGVLAATRMPGSFALWEAVCAEALGLDEHSVGQGFRKATTAGILVRSENDQWMVHDAFRVVLGDDLPSGPERARLNQSLLVVLRQEMPRSRSPEVFLAYLRVVRELGDYAHLSDLASGLAETVRDMGIAGAAEALLRDALGDEAVSPRDKFWLYDTLAYFAVEARDASTAKEHLDREEELVREFGFGVDERGAFLNKALLVHGALGTLGDLPGHVAKAMREQKPETARITLYNFAVALGTSVEGSAAHAIALLWSLVDQYLEVTGWDLEYLTGGPAKPLSAIGASLKHGATRDDVRHLADCFDAIAKIASRTMDPPDEMILVAGQVSLNLYAVAHAYKSLVKAACFLADHMLHGRGDRTTALQLLRRHALPAARAAGLVQETILARAQLAQALAALGDGEAAREEIRLLRPYAETDDDPSAELRALLESAERHLARGIEPTDGEWYGGQPRWGMAVDVKMTTYRGWTIVVGRDPVDGDWHAFGQPGFWVSLPDFRSAEAEAEPLCSPEQPSREAAFAAACEAIDKRISGE